MPTGSLAAQRTPLRPVSVLNPYFLPTLAIPSIVIRKLVGTQLQRAKKSPSLLVGELTTDLPRKEVMRY